MDIRYSATRSIGQNDLDFLPSGRRALGHRIHEYTGRRGICGCAVPFTTLSANTVPRVVGNVFGIT